MQQVRSTPELITLQEARQLLGVSPRTLERRIADEHLTKYRNPVDRRSRMLDRYEVESLLEFEIVHPRDRVA